MHGEQGEPTYNEISYYPMPEWLCTIVGRGCNQGGRQPAHWTIKIQFVVGGFL